VPSVLILASLSSCSSARDGGASPNDIAIPTSSWKPGDPVQTFDVEGTLVADGSCIRIRREDGVVVTPVWPAALHARSGSGGQIELLDADDRQVASKGDRVKLDGGYTSDVSGMEPCVTDPDVFVVQEIPGEAK